MGAGGPRMAPGSDTSWAASLFRLLPITVSILLLLLPTPHLASHPTHGGGKAYLRRLINSQRSSMTVGEGLSSPGPRPPQVVWTLIFGDSRGSVSYQYYLPESIRQARLWNPGVPFYLLTDDPARFFRERPTWYTLFSQPHFNVSVEDVSSLRGWELQHLEMRMRDIWGPLGHQIGTMMLPSLAGGTNFAFTVVTLTRLIYLHHWLEAQQQQQAWAFNQPSHNPYVAPTLHLENDQMLYAPITQVTGPAAACGVDFGVGWVAPGRLAAAVMYLSGPSALRPFLDFLWEALSSGWGHAAEVAESYWVTDMSLAAAFVKREEGRVRGVHHSNNNNVTVFPPPHAVNATTTTTTNADDSGGSDTTTTTCLARTMTHIVDAAVLGIWCCGDMGRGREWGSVKTEYADPEYRERVWGEPVVWEVRGVGGEGEEELEVGALPPKVEAGERGGGGGDWITHSVVQAEEDYKWGEEARQSRLAPLAPAAAAAPPPAATAKGGGRGGGWVKPNMVRLPVWNHTRLFNLHLSSKMLHWWRSDDLAPPLEAFPGECGEFP